MDLMKKTTALVKGTIQAPITYEHRVKNAVAGTTYTTATGNSLQNYRYKNDTIEDAKRFILSPRIVSGVVEDFLILKPKRHDTIVENGEVWYVIEASVRDVELDVLCGKTAYTETTKRVSF